MVPSRNMSPFGIARVTRTAIDPLMTPLRLVLPVPVKSPLAIKLRMCVGSSPGFAALIASARPNTFIPMSELESRERAVLESPDASADSSMRTRTRFTDANRARVLEVPADRFTEERALRRLGAGIFLGVLSSFVIALFRYVRTDVGDATAGGDSPRERPSPARFAA